MKHLWTALDVELADSVCAKAKSYERGNDRSGTGPGDVIEIICKYEIGLAIERAQFFFNPREDLDRYDAANSAAVTREQFSRAAFAKIVFHIFSLSLYQVLDLKAIHFANEHVSACRVPTKRITSRLMEPLMALCPRTGKMIATGL